MSSGRKPNLAVRIGVLGVTMAVAAVAIVGATEMILPPRSVRMLGWEEMLTTFIGVWLLACIPISLMRWVVVPEARIKGLLANALISMAVGGLSLILPVLSEGRIDPALAFGLFLILCLGLLVISLRMNRKSDELMRRYNSDASAISYAVMLGAFSIYAAGEYLGVIDPISPWGLVGIACILQFAVSMYVYYRLGMNPEAQEKAAA